MTFLTFVHNIVRIYSWYSSLWKHHCLSLSSSSWWSTGNSLSGTRQGFDPGKNSRRTTNLAKSESEFLDVIGRKVLRVFLRAFQKVPSTNGFYSPPPPWANVIWNCAFINSASGTNLAEPHPVWLALSFEKVQYKKEPRRESSFIANHRNRIFSSLLADTFIMTT